MISRLIIATRNPGKSAEIQNALKNLVHEVLSLAEFPGIPEIAETGTTFEENARIKADTVYEATGLPTLADDSGLEVDYLNGAPGVYSARYSGENATDARNNEKLLAALKNVAPEKRTARFRCVMVLQTGEKTITVDGSCEGIILTGLKGTKGFGYDPLFYIPELKKTFAEISLAQKNQLSHRGLALRRMREILEKDEKSA